MVLVIGVRNMDVSQFHNRARQGEARLGRLGFGVACLGSAWRGAIISQGWVGLGGARLGLVRYGTAGLGKMRPGMTRQGKA